MATSPEPGHDRAPIELRLSAEDRRLILEHGYPFPELEAELRRLANRKGEAVVPCDPFEIEQLLGDLAYSNNHAANRALGERLNLLYEDILADAKLSG